MSEGSGAHANPVDVAREIALRQLTARSRSRAELLAALARRNVDAEVAETVVARLVEVGLVNDEQFAADWVASRQTRRQLSKRALREELRRKGIDAEIITATLADVEDDDEYAAAAELARKKARSTAGLDVMVRKRRLAAALARRGFSAAITARVVSEVVDQQ